MRAKEVKLIITFHSTTAAMIFEKTCMHRNISGRLIPVPSEISAGCGLAWMALTQYRNTLEQLINENNLETSGMYELLI